MPSMVMLRWSLVPHVAIAASTDARTATHLETVIGDAVNEIKPLSTATTWATASPMVCVASASKRTRPEGIARVWADESASAHAPEVPPVQACVIAVGLVAKRYETAHPDSEG